MLILKKELYLEDFEQEFQEELRGVSSEAAAIIFDTLCMNPLADDDVDAVSDYLRFDVQVMSLEDVINDYGYLMDLEGLEDADLVDAVKKCIDNQTFLLGTFEEEEQTFFIFDEF